MREPSGGSCVYTYRINTKTQIYTQKSRSETGEVWIKLVNFTVSVLCCGIIALQIIIGGNWIKCIRDLSYFLQLHIYSYLDKIFNY